jgi:diguanylate cyclase
VSIDDFGTGHSSLGRLRKLPATELKIDRSMVMDIEHSADARAIVNAVVQMAHALDKKVVAEGVENQRQQQVLVDLGCDELQGYLFARPMSARALLLWALGGRSDAPKFKPSLFGETRTASSEQKAEVRARRPGTPDMGQPPAGQRPVRPPTSVSPTRGA